MAKVTFLKPNAVSSQNNPDFEIDLPAVPARKLRDVISNSESFKQRNSSEYQYKDFLSPDEVSKIEVENVFFDILYDENKCKIIAIGPNYSDLYHAKDLVEFSVVLSGYETPVSLPVRIDTAPRNYCIVYANLPSHSDSEISKVFLVFKNETRLGPFDLTVVKKSHGAALAAINKNNSVAWISDWICYHYLVGVNSFAIYDNGSKNLAELAEEIRRIPYDIEVLLVEWSFSFGPQRAPDFKFAQPIMLQHASIYFSYSSIFINIDIDEYIFLTGNEVSFKSNPLVNHGRVGAVYFRKFDVVTSDKAQLDRWPVFRAEDFSQVVLPARSNAKKYFVKPSAVRCMDVHYCQLKRGWSTVSALDSAIVCLHFLPLTTGFQSEARRYVGLPTKFEEILDKSNGESLFGEKNAATATWRSPSAILRTSRHLTWVVRFFRLVPRVSSLSRKIFLLLIKSKTNKLSRSI